MYIKWLNHPTDKTLNGQNFHVPRSVGEPAIYFQQAILAERLRYGSPEWAAERARDGKTQRCFPEQRRCFSGNVEGTKWSLITRASNGRQLLVKRTGTEILLFSRRRKRPEKRLSGICIEIIRAGVPSSKRKGIGAGG